MISLSCLVEAKTGAYPFSSVQVNLPKLVSKRIIQWGEDTIPDSDIYEDPEDPAYGREYETHVTVLYGIHDESPKEICKLLTRQKPFHIELGKISVFTSPPKCDVVKIEVESPELRRINKLISECMVVTNNHNAYRPHITICYVKKGLATKYIGINEFSGNRLLIDRLVFSSKNGIQTTISLNDE